MGKEFISLCELQLNLPFQILMSVPLMLITVPLMLTVPTPLVASPVPVTWDTVEMDSPVWVSSSFLYVNSNSIFHFRY